ncbi:discoidin domain-containing protein [Streptomyces sp. NPDC004435]|uniref:alpha-L-rhamnosidase-related protein n=1 Tax=Streptomyces sp. NPDC004435 TaxID=3364701 RepID=UPI00369F1BE5
MWAGAGAANQWAAFRRVVRLPGVPTSAITRIAVDSKYWLYVNGNLVIFEGGLKRGPNPNDTYYDQVDLAPHLVEGDNTIAVLAWHFGKHSFSHKNSGKAGLLFESSIVAGDTTTSVVSGTGWKAMVHPGYGADTSGGQPNWRLPESNIHYDARNASNVNGWHTPAYNDSAWPSATDQGATGAAPWNALVKRPIPFFRTTGLLAYTNHHSLPGTGQGTTVITAKLPSNIQITPYLKVDAPAGAVINIQTDHYTDGGENNLRSTYITTGGVQEFESLGWLSGTAVHYTIPSSVTILELRYRESGYDTSFTGSFTSNDPYFNALWGKASRTMYVNMRDTYFDCPTRERAQWWGDVVNQLKEGFYTFDPRSNDLGRKAISELAAWQKPDGVLYSPVPAGNWSAELPTQMLASVWSLETFHTYTGDTTTVSSVYPQVKKYLNLWTLDADGLVNHRAGGWDWEDWGSNIDARILDNAWYYLASGSAITLAELSGNSTDVATWQGRRNSIKANFDRVLWDAARKEYRSPGYNGDTDDRGNALAVVAGLAAPANHPHITKVLTEHMNASPYLEFYVLEALYLMGAVSVAESRMRTRYAQQVADPGYTLWEFWTKGGSGTDNHAWNGGPLYVLSAYAAGVRPTEPGWGKYDVVPQTGTFTHINTVTPTVRGNIGLDIERADGTVTLRLESPSGTTARLGVPTYGGQHPEIKTGSTVVYRDGAPVGSVSGVSYAGRDGSYVYFQMEPGTRTFTATGVGSLSNLAVGKPVTSNNTLENAHWGVAKLTDGHDTSVSGAKGYTSNDFPSSDASASPVWVEIDLGADTDLDAVRLFPRTDTPASGGGTAGFPVDFTVQTRTSGGTTYSTVRTVTAAANPNGRPQTYGFKSTRARYVRLRASKLGTPATDEPTRYRLQLAEAHIPARGTTVTSNSSLENSDWGRDRLLDGILTSAVGTKGYTSHDFASADVSGSPVWVEFDLGTDRAFSSVMLFPRTDTAAAGGGTAGFPVDFTIQTRTASGTGYTTVRSVTGQPSPGGQSQTFSLPSASGRYLRLHVTRLGAPASDESGRFRLQLAQLVIE